MAEMLRILTVFLSLAGLVDALYFTFTYYGRIKKARWIPEILCAREASNCVTVVQTPYARVFGVPNSLLGVVYYLLLIAWASEGDRRIAAMLPGGFPAPHMILLATSGLTVALGFYLIYSLRRRLHIHCPLCYTAHAINAALFVLLIALAY